MNRRLRLIALFCALALSLPLAVLASGCGGSDSSGSTGAGGAGTEGTEQTAALTKAEFIKQGDKICRDAVAERTQAFLAEVRALQKEGKQVNQQVELRLIDEIYIPAMGSMVDELDALAPPAAQAEELEAIVDGFRESVEQVEADPQSSLTADVFGPPAEQARTFGFEWCSEL